MMTEDHFYVSHYQASLTGKIPYGENQGAGRIGKNKNGAGRSNLEREHTQNKKRVIKKSRRVKLYSPSQPIDDDYHVHILKS